MSGKRQTRKQSVACESTKKKETQNVRGKRSAKKSSSKSDGRTDNKGSKIPLSESVQNSSDESTVCKNQNMKTKTKPLSQLYSYDKNSNRKNDMKTQHKPDLEPHMDYNNTHCGKYKNSSFTGVLEEDIFLSKLNINGFEKCGKLNNKKVCNPIAARSQNMVHFLQQMSFGMNSRLQLTQSVKRPIIDICREMKMLTVASPFDRRVTAIEWHPTLKDLVAVGSKGGDIILWNSKTVDKDKFVSGIGAAGSCQAIKFWPWDLSRVVSASINGTITVHDFEGRNNIILADTMDSYDHWFCSVDVNPSRYMVAAGRNGGILQLMSSEGRKIFEYRLHKNKITHVEFSPREEWLLCTASTDHTVQLWDVRYMKDRKNALNILKHEKPVNSAYFSRTDGCRLLTTDQKNEIRVYGAPEWRLETSIQHPHRFFQHISPFKATWHPLQDLIICGRYPDKEFPGYHPREARTLDLFDGQTGEQVAKLHDPEVEGLCPINKFNNQGDALASGMGFHIKLWTRNDDIDASREQLIDKLESSDLLKGYLNRPGNRTRSARGQGRGDEDDTDNLKKKKKRKANTKMDVMAKTAIKVLKKK